MKKIWQYLSHHLKEDFKPGQYVAVFLFLGTAIFLNYRYDFYYSVVNTEQGFTRFFHYFLFYGFAYFFAIVTSILWQKQKSILRQRDFWFKFVFITSMLALDNSLPFLWPLIIKYLPDELQLWTFKVTNNLMSLFTIIIPILLYYRSKEKSETHLYGLQLKNFDSRPYLILLLLMVPLIAAASFTESFQRQYPMYWSSEAHNYLGVSEKFTALTYEVAYGFDFISVEYLFRGFMVIGMASLLGRNAVLTMAVAYCFLHFGKPPGEAISSIFGGYLLGVIAYETKNVWGGIMIHLGIAWGMELAAWMQKA